MHTHRWIFLILPALIVGWHSIARGQGTLSIIQIPTNSNFSTTKNYYQTYVGNKGSSSVALDGIHLKRLSGSNVLVPSNFSLSGFETAPTNTTTAMAALRWSGTSTVSGKSNLLITVSSDWSTAYLSSALLTANTWSVGFRADGVVYYVNRVCQAAQGDANVDGIVDSSDSTICAAYNNQWVYDDPDTAWSNPTWRKCDFNGDGYSSATEGAMASGTGSNWNKACGPAGVYTQLCQDGSDNDGDGKIDYSAPAGFTADDGCTSATDTSE